MNPNLFEFYSPPQVQGPIVVSVPHAGLVIPEERHELMMLPTEIFLRDVDFEVHQIWQEASRELNLAFVRSRVHRYAIDLNRRLDQVDAAMIESHPRPAGSEKRGLFWTHSTQKEALSPGGINFQPLKPKVAKSLIETLWHPYYNWIQRELSRAKEKFGFAILIDGHSMPSRGTDFHDDPSQARADIVPGNLQGKSCHPRITAASERIAAKLDYSLTLNNPYSGGGITHHFGKPAQNIHALQIEVNRNLYMDETAKVLHPNGLKKLQIYAFNLLTELLALRAEDLSHPSPPLT